MEHIVGEFQESIDTFEVSFGGENIVDAELFSKTIDNTIHLIKTSALIIDPQAFLRLNIKAQKEGSFVVTLDAIVRVAKDLFTRDNLNLAAQTLTVFTRFFEIKKHLKGKKPVGISQDATGNKIIKNHDSELLTVEKKTADAFFNNASIDGSIILMFNDLENFKRKSISITKNRQNVQVTFNENDYPSMAAPIVEAYKNEELTHRESLQILENCELIIKKPDLLGDSKWEFIFDKRIQAKIEDKEFLNQIKEGKIKISGGCILIGTMQIKTSIDINYDVLTVEYIIKKVTSIKNKDNQLELF